MLKRWTVTPCGVPSCQQQLLWPSDYAVRSSSVWPVWAEELGEWERPDISLSALMCSTLCIPSHQERSPERLSITVRCFPFITVTLHHLIFSALANTNELVLI